MLLVKLFVIMPKSTFCIHVGFVHVSNNLAIITIVSMHPKHGEYRICEEKRLFKAVCRVTIDYHLSRSAPILVYCTETKNLILYFGLQEMRDPNFSA